MMEDSELDDVTPWLFVNGEVIVDDCDAVADDEDDEVNVPLALLKKKLSADCDRPIADVLLLLLAGADPGVGDEGGGC